MASIRSRLSFFVGGIALLTMLAAGGILFAVHDSDDALERLVASQHRLDLLAEVSGRVTDYALAAVDLADAPPQGRARLDALRDRANAAFAAVDASRASDADDRQAIPQSRNLAHLKADFTSLDADVGHALELPDASARADAIRGSLNAFSLSAAPNLSLLVETERGAVKSGRDALQATASRLAVGAVCAAILVAFAAALMHLTITRPLLRRIASIAEAARDVARGELGLRLPAGPHDELGVVVARFNRMAATLARRERRLATDRAGLESTIALRTGDLTAANEKLAEADRARRRFFADISHELRTPLTVVLGECDVALRAPGLTDEMIRPVLTTIRQRASRLNRRVEDLLRVARSETGMLALDIRPITVVPILVEAVEAYAKSAARRGISLDFQPPATAIDAMADADWLRQVVEGLIDNAIRHATGASAISLSLTATEDEVRIAVADDGSGIPVAARERVFERFVKRDDAEKSGFGIGLALARWVVTRHRGTIIISSDPPRVRGTEVTLTLPRKHRETNSEADSDERADRRG
jgi:two-component system, OmpR family, sensor kinase